MFAFKDVFKNKPVFNGRLELWTVGMQVVAWSPLSRHDRKVYVKNKKVIAKYCGDNKVLTNVKLIAFHTHRLISTTYKYILYVFINLYH